MNPAVPDSARIDFVRSVAVLLVLADHVLETLGAFHGFDPTPVAWILGRAGVLLFFVLTSLVLLQSLERAARAGRSSTIGFYVQRAFRIYPLAWVCIALVLALRIPATSWSTEFVAPSAGMLLSNLALTMNLTYSQFVLSVLWTLPFELQMYLFLPFVHRALPGAATVRNAALLVALAVAIGVVQPHVAGRLSLAEFGPCFLAGALAFALARKATPRFAFAVLPLALAALLAGYVAVARQTAEVHPRWLQWSACLALGVLLPFVREPGSRAIRRISREIARYSYGIYLFHLVALYAGMNVLREHALPVQLGALLALLVGLPVLGHHLVEQPGIALGRRLAALSRSRRSGRPRVSRATPGRAG